MVDEQNPDQACQYATANTLPGLARAYSWCQLVFTKAMPAEIGTNISNPNQAKHIKQEPLTLPKILVQKN